MCNNPEALPDVRGADRASWNIKRPCGVAFAFQVREYLVQAQFDEPSNVFSNNPIWPAFPDKPKHFRPEVAGVVLCSLFTRVAEGLAREAAANKSGVRVGKVLSSDISYISKDWYVGPVVPQHCLAVGLILHKACSTKKTGGLEP
jgi:hypothetical protein